MTSQHLDALQKAVDARKQLQDRLKAESAKIAAEREAAQQAQKG